MSKEDNNVIEVTKEKIEDAIKKLLGLAYEELKGPKYTGYPTSDYIACFLDAKDALGNEFNNIFNNAVPDYKDNWEKFEGKVIKLRFDKIFYSISQLKNSESSDFDFFSKQHNVICNVSLASVLLLIYTYASKNHDWLNDKKENLVKITELLLETYIPEKGWQYYFKEGEKEFVHTLSTWLSLLALIYIPEEIITDDLKNKIVDTQNKAKKWLESNIQREDKYCSCCFRPEEIDDTEENTLNPVATAQAILALHYAGMDIDDKTIKCSIEFVKNKKTSIENSVKDEIPPRRIAQNYQGIQHCLQALLCCQVSHEDEAVRYLLRETLDKVDVIFNKKRKSPTDKYAYYTSLAPILWYLYPSTMPEVKPILKPILLGPSEFRSEFESFIAKRENSIILIGEIDAAYAKILDEQSKSRDIKVTVYHPPKQDGLLIQDRNWDLIEMDWRFENLHCAIVDDKEGLFSSGPFRESKYFNIIKRLDDEELSNLISQLNGIIGVKSEEEIKEIVSKNFPKQSEKMNVKDLEGNQLEGILTYYKFKPEYSEAVPSSLGFAGGESREDIEVKFSKRGIISRLFMNSELESLIKNEINDNNLVMDESSAFLLLNSSNMEKDIRTILDVVKGDLYVLSDIHKRLAHLRLVNTAGGRLHPIDDESIDPEIRSGHYHLTKNEKIVISYTRKNKGTKHGIITNTWEVTKVCMEHDINVYSLVKFVDKDEETYNMFRIPVDLLDKV